MKVAAIQFRCGVDIDENLGRASDLVRDAAQRGARIVVLPELFSTLHHHEQMRQRGEPLDGPSLRWASALARSTGVALVAGSIVEQDADDRYNTCVAVSPDGTVAATYRKVHLFDVDLGTVAARESDSFRAGPDATVADVAGVKVGLTICYDLRFPELFRIETLRGAEIIAAPSAFTATTGRDHWELLVRARAVENQVAMIAAAQWGTSPDGVERHGHSMVVDAWGRVLADAGPTGDAVLVVDVDLSAQADIRRRLPSLSHRRQQAYRWPD